VDGRSFPEVALLAGVASISRAKVCDYKSSRFQVSRWFIGLKTSTENIRIAAISDVHAPCSRTGIRELVHAINESEPDVFMLLGDIVDERGDEGFVGEFKAVRASSLKVAVLGNWEYMGKLDLKKLQKEYAAAGISLLVNKVVLAKDLAIAGLDDLLLGRPDYSLIKDHAKISVPLVVLAHCPGDFKAIANYGKEQTLVISGHTHGGQIAPFGRALITPKGSGPYVHGWYQDRGNAMYVTRGVGTCPWVPFRMGARPELFLLEIGPNRSQDDKPFFNKASTRNVKHDRARVII
jgi:hypothetical protein